MKGRWKDGTTLEDNVASVLPEIASDYFDAGEEAMKPGTSWDDMHQFRLATKRFRYTLELFQDVYGPGLEARIKELRSVQTALGDINDCVMTKGLLDNVEDVEPLRRELTSKADKLMKKLWAYWARTFESPAAQRRWTNYLSRYAGSGKSYV